jgi:hypothetical protein
MKMKKKRAKKVLFVVRVVVVVVVVARTVFIDAGKAVKNEGLSQHLERANEVTLI